MSTQINHLLAQWHTVVREKDIRLLSTLLAEDVEFHSPTVWNPKKGHQITLHILKTVMDIFQDFTYHREFISENSIALEFSALVGDKNIKGIDIIRWNDEGKIEHFEVLLRPLNGLQAMLEIMTKNLQNAGYVAKD